MATKNHQEDKFYQTENSEQTIRTQISIKAIWKIYLY